MKFQIGDEVRKVKGSQWHGRVVGTYSTDLTPEGYAVESSTEKGSVQIYPAAALEIAEGTNDQVKESPGNWQPIDTAPLDGTIVLLHKSGEVFAGWYEESDGYGCVYGWNFVDDSTVNLQFATDGDYIIPNAFGKEHGPTHWMPLPKAPDVETDDEVRDTVLNPLALWGKEMSNEQMLRLIAAAPDLLEALETVVANAPEPYCAITRSVDAQCRAAIAKATKP